MAGGDRWNVPFRGRIIKHKPPPLGYVQVCTDGAYTENVKASFAAASDPGIASSWCDGFTLGWTEELTPDPTVHELIGAKHGLLLALRNVPTNPDNLGETSTGSKPKQDLEVTDPRIIQRVNESTL